MPTIMVVAGDPTLRNLIAFLLNQEGLDTTALGDPREALDRLGRDRPDLVLLDGAVGDTDPLDLCQGIRLRREFDQTPILMLTEGSARVDRLKAFSAGADAVASKPFDSMELLLHVKALLRLTSHRRDGGAEPPLRAGGVRLVPARLLVELDGREVALTRTETALLGLLMASPGAVFAADTLAQRLAREMGGACTPDAVHAHVRNLRAKIERDPKRPTRLVTIGRKGYCYQI